MWFLKYSCIMRFTFEWRMSFNPIKHAVDLICKFLRLLNDQHDKTLLKNLIGDIEWQLNCMLFHVNGLLYCYKISLFVAVVFWCINISICIKVHIFAPFGPLNKMFFFLTIFPVNHNHKAIYIYIYIYINAIDLIQTYTVPSTNIGTLGKYEQRRLWK